MEFKGTKGKWQFRRNGQQVIKVLGTKTKKVCEINCNYNNRLDEVNFANALLISKAPEMLEMLQFIKSNGSICDWNKLENQIDKLIKEATEIC